MSDKLTDKLVTPGEKPQLSPNPDGSGYVAQYEVDSLPVSGIKVNALYILKDGRHFKYDPVQETWLRVDNGPDHINVDGGRGTPVHENQKPKVRPQVFSNPVAFNGGVFVDGKKLQDYIDSQGGVTEQELQTALQAYLEKTEGAKLWYIPDFPDDVTNVSNNMKSGDIIIDVANSLVLIITQNDQDWFLAVGLSVTVPTQFVLHKGVDEEFRISELEVGTKLYKYILSYYDAQEFTSTTLMWVSNKSDINSLYSVQLYDETENLIVFNITLSDDGTMKALFDYTTDITGNVITIQHLNGHTDFVDLIADGWTLTVTPL